MSKENKLIPELRFPEFRDDGEWVYEEINNHIDFLSGIALKSEEISDDNSGTPILRGINITEGHIRHSLEIDKYYLEDITDLKLYLVEENDIVLGMDGSKVGKNVALISKHDAGSILIQRVARLRARNSDIAFLYQHFLSERFIRYVDRVNTSSGIPHISAQQIKEFEIGIPPKLQEQQKIAACLSTLDDLIATHNDKLEALKDHKKGLMQNLFPQEGETVPKVRFPEFENDGDWVEKKLGEISKKIMVGIASAATHAYRETGIVLIRNQNIKEGYLDDKDILFIDKDYEKIHKNKRLIAGDLLTARTGYPGTTCIVPEKYEGSQSFTTLITRPNKSIVSSNFLCLFINSEKGQSYFEVTKIGGGQKNVNAGSLTELPIMFPAKDEQQKIASCLSAVDNLITAQQEKIEQIQQHKKGLMQGLFPKIEN